MAPNVSEALTSCESMANRPPDSCTAISRCYPSCPHQGNDTAKSSESRTDMCFTVLRIPHPELHLPQGSRTVISHLPICKDRDAEVWSQDKVEIIILVRKRGNYRDNWKI
jgi:hypothetical protein